MSKNTEDTRTTASEEDLTCGCFKTIYTDGSHSIDPCLGHGLLEVAAGLGHAAHILELLGNGQVADAHTKTLTDHAADVEAPHGPTGVVE